MKKLLLAQLFFFIYIIQGVSQSSVKLTQFFQSPQIYNPAFSGVEPFTDLKFGRKQNLGNYEYAPKTTFFSATTSANASAVNRAQQYSLRISNPELYNNLRNPSFYVLKHGFGLIYVNENQDAFTQQRVQLSYALHFGLGDRLRLSLAISPYLFSNRVDVDKIKFETNPEPVYSQFNKISYTHFGANAGLLLYSRHFYFGYSAINAFTTTPSISEKIPGAELNYEKLEHRLMTGGAFNLSRSFEMLPSVVFTYTPHYPSLVNLNLRFRYEKQFWAGLSYQNSGTISLVAGGIINDWLNVGYSYDHTVKGVSNYVSGSHGLIVGLRLFRNTINKPYLW